MQGIKHKAPPKLTKSKVSQDTIELPSIPPDKRYFTIGEVALLCGVKPHVLRYWEHEFSQIKLIKRRGNRRCYQYQDILLIRNIRTLLYEDGFTIESARAQLNTAEINQSAKTDVVVKKIIADLETVLHKLKMDEFEVD